MSEFSFVHWLIVAAIGYVIWRIFRDSGGAALMVCKSCGCVDTATSRVRGSIWIEIVLWLCFIVPGLVYSLWRLTTRHKTCRQCGGGEMIPAGSPIGKRIVAQNSERAPA